MCGACVMNIYLATGYKSVIVSIIVTIECPPHDRADGGGVV